MREVHTEIEIDAAPEEVWRVLTDFDAYAEWNPFVKSVRGEPAVGARLEILVQVPEGRAVKFRPRVLRAEPARELRWVGTLPVPGLFSGEHFFRLEPSGAGRTRFLHGELLSGLLIPFMGATLEKSARGYVLMNEALKRRVEGAAGRGGAGEASG